MAALVIRLVIGVASGSLGEDAMTASGPDSPRLIRVAAMLAVGFGVLARPAGGPSRGAPARSRPGRSRADSPG